MSDRDAIVAWIRREIAAVQADNSYWGGPHRQAYPDVVRIADAIERGDHLPAIVADGEDPVSILLDAADNIADYHGGGWGLSREVVDAAKAKITTHAGEVERLREALRAIQMEAERENGGWVHLKRAIAIAARQALEASQ